MEFSPEHAKQGKIAYDAYCKQTGGASLISGGKLLEFEILKPSIQEAWMAAAFAVRSSLKFS